MKTLRMRHASTLVESLVAVVVIAVLMGSLLQWLQSTQRVSGASDAKLQAALLARMAVERLRSRLACDPAYLLSDRDTGKRLASLVSPEAQGALEVDTQVEAAISHGGIACLPGYLRQVTVDVRPRGQVGARPVVSLKALLLLPPESMSRAELDQVRGAFPSTPPPGPAISLWQMDQLHDACLADAAGALTAIGHALVREVGAAPGLPLITLHRPATASPTRPLQIWRAQLDVAAGGGTGSSAGTRDPAMRRGYVRVTERVASVQLDACRRANVPLQRLAQNATMAFDHPVLTRLGQDLSTLNGLLRYRTQKLALFFPGTPALGAPVSRRAGWELEVRQLIARINANRRALGFVGKMRELLVSPATDLAWNRLLDKPSQFVGTVARLCTSLDAVARDARETASARRTASLRLVEALLGWQLASSRTDPDLVQLAPRLATTYAGTLPELARYLGETEVLRSSLFLQHRELADQLARLMAGPVRWRGASQGGELASALAEARRQLLHRASGTLAAYAEAQQLLRGLGAAPVEVQVCPPIVQRTAPPASLPPVISGP